MANMPAASSSSTSIDLSRLPAPTIVEQLDYETIRAQLLAKLVELLPTFDATVESDPAVKVLEVAAYHELLLRQDFNDRARQLLVAYATGSNLEALGALFGVPRLEITPEDPTTGAAAVYEDQDAYRQRIILAPESYSVAGPELAYVAHAKSASADVLDASAVSPTPGAILVSVLSAQGDGTAAPELVAAVNAIVADPAVRPLGDQVTTASADIVRYEIAAEITTFSGPDLVLVLASARAALDAYIAENHKLGRNHRRAGITAALDVVGVENIVLSSPADDVLCDNTQAAWPTVITLTHAGYAS